MCRTFACGVAVAMMIASTGTGAEHRRDNDGDGIWDEHEAVLGTDPNHAEPLRVILEDGPESDERRQRAGYDATKDFTKIEFCHVGEDRFLWRATMVSEPRLEDTVFHLYVDADADSSTGRQGNPKAASTGTEYMLTIVGGRGRSSHYAAEGNGIPGPLVSYAVQGKTLLISADVDLGRDEQGIRYALYVLCHSITGSGKRPPMSDSTGKRPIAGVKVSDRKKVLRPRDHNQNFRVSATFGPQRLRDVLVDQANIIVRHDALERDGFEVDQFTSRRWPHVKLSTGKGRLWTAAPKPGRYYVGFMMYDDSNDERVGIYVDGKMCGVAVANQDNNQTWMYWLQQPHEFRGGERVELRALGAGGKHGICNVLFLAQPPKVRNIEYAVGNMTAGSQVGQSGSVTLSWTTTWPCQTRFEFGLDTKYGKTFRNEGNCLVHRVVLDGLDANGEYHGRAIGTARDGEPFYGDDFVFQASPPAMPQTRPAAVSVPLVVRNPHPHAVANWPVTTGIPFPEGQLGSPDHVRLLLGEREVPAQVRLTARWRDGSVKWLLVTFLANVPPAGEKEYKIEFGRQVRRAPVAKGLSVTRQPEGTTIDTGALRLKIDSHGNLADLQRDGKPLLSQRAVCATHATDADGVQYSTAGGKAEVSLEEAGPLRAVVKTVSHLMSRDGEKSMRVEKRIEAYLGSASLRVHHTFLVNGPKKFTEIESLSYHIPVRTANRSFRVPTAAGRTLELGKSQLSVRQRFDDELVVVTGAGESPSKDRVVGSIAADGEDGWTLAVRDFWQNYPKAFSVRPDGIDVGLCPDFDEGLYDKFPFEKEGHQLYYYLLNGRYRLKQGVAKTHEMWLCFEPQPRQRTAAGELFQRPPLATADPAWYCGTKVFYDVAPRNTREFKLYEEAIDRNIEAYAARRERQHDFGMLNYGDWYGERGTNWGNIEYDTQHAFFLEYIRSGNPDAFFLGEATELHNRDVDTLQWSEDPRQIGAVYVHQMCHVGEYYDKPVPGSLGFPRGGYTVSHAWTEGHFDHYFLSGDRRSYETGVAIADFFIRKQLGRPYNFSTCRTPGWHLIMLASAYAATNDPYYLNAAKVVVEQVLETQEKKPRPLPAYQAQGRKPFQIGGWSRMMVPGHCLCEPRHRGNAGFMVAVLLSGLKYYHDVTGDERVKECIIRGAHYFLEETYSDEVRGFRYTSCPNGRYRPGASPLMVEGIARAYLWTKDERFRRVLTEALPISAGGSGYGKSFSMYYRMAPRLLADLKAAGITMDEKPSPKE